MALSFSQVKIIDFGSAVIADPDLPRPFYKRFYGTTAYAAPEILLEKSYQAPPAEVWTLGILLSYLLTGTHPFPTVEDATKGKFSLDATEELPESAISLMQRCLDPNPQTRATIREIKDHDWLLRQVLQSGWNSFLLQIVPRVDLQQKVDKVNLRCGK